MTTATCPSWQANSLSQTPCQVWQALGQHCSSSFTINTVDFSSSNYRPTEDICQCNIVAYNLMAGCFWCQDPAASAWPSLTDWATNCRNTTFRSDIPFSLASAITYPHWATIQPIGTTWSATEALADAEFVSSTSSSSRGYYTGSSSFDGPYYNSYGYRDNFYVFYILLITAVCLLIVVGLAWCVVLCIFWHRQRDRARLYNDLATYYRFGPATGSQTIPLMQTREPNSMYQQHPQFLSPQTAGGTPYRSSVYPGGEEAAQPSAAAFAEYNAGPSRELGSHPVVLGEGQTAMVSHRAHDSPMHSPLIPISPQPERIDLKEDIKGKGRVMEGGA